MHEQNPSPEPAEEMLCYQRTCPHCGKELYTVRLGFCPYCGGSLTKDIPQADTAPKELRDDYRRLQEEYESLEEELEHLQREHTHLQESFDGLLSERNRLADENTQLRHRLKETTKDLQQWMLGSQGLNLRLKEVTEECTAAKQEMQHLKRRLEAATAHGSADTAAVLEERSRLLNELEALRYELRAKDQEMQKYRAASRKVPDLEQQKTLLTEMVSQRDAEIQHLRAIGTGKPGSKPRRSSVGEVRDEELLKSNIELKSELFTAKEQQNQLKKDLAAAKEEADALRRQNLSHEQIMQEQAAESAKAIAAVQQESETQLTELREQLAAIQEERDSLQEEIALRDTQIHRMKQENAFVNLPESGIEREFAEVSRENSQLRETIKEQGKKLKSVTKQLLFLKNQQGSGNTSGTGSIGAEE